MEESLVIRPRRRPVSSDIANQRDAAYVEQFCTSKANVSYFDVDLRFSNMVSICCVSQLPF